MAAEAPPSPLPASSGGNAITSLNDNDVMLGRGTGPNEFIGNRRFRDLIEQRQEEYNSIRGPNKHAEKRLIACEVIAQIHNLGGRFLKRVKIETPADGTLPEVEESVAVEKCQQALRDYRKQRRSSVGNGVRNNENNENEAVMSSRAAGLPTIASGIFSGAGDEILVAPSSLEGAIHILPDPLPVLPSTLLPWMPFGISGANIADAHISALHHEVTVTPQIRNDVRVIPGVRTLASQDTLVSRNSGIAPGHGIAAENVVGEQSNVDEFDRRHGSSDMTMARPSISEAVVPSAASQVELSEYLLSLLTWNRRMITEEQVELERAAMTVEERVEALMDLFGKQCAVDEHQSKRVRKDLDNNSIDFLVQVMRSEIGRIPKDRKQALLEAQTKCRAYEFSDTRLERFLRCEGMNVKVRLRDIYLCAIEVFQKFANLLVYVLVN